MRKTIISALAFFSLIACVQEEVVSVSETDAITFDNQFVDITTRAESFVKENLDAFNVWGYINTPAAPLFEGTEVVRNASGAWSYDGTRYWIPQQNYYFAAIAPANSDSWSLTTYDNMMDDYLASEYGPGILTFTNPYGSEDLIYAASHVVAAESGHNQPVSFLFRHLLSKVRFSFANEMNNPYINVRISDIIMRSPLSASIDLASETLEWASHYDENVLDFSPSALMAYPGVDCYSEDLFVIPSTSSIPYEITFKIELVMDGVNGTEEVLYSAVKNASVSGTALEMGSGYNFSASITPDILSLDTIEFTVEHVDTWEEASDLSKIAIASKLGGEVTLTENEVVIPYSDVIVVAEDLTINLNGKTLSYYGDNRMFKVIGDAVLTINGEVQGSIVYVESDNLNESTTAAYVASAYDDSQIIIKGGIHTTNGCTLYHADGGTVDIYSGEFAATETGYDPQEKYEHEYTLDIEDANGDIIVRGGSFYKYNPSESFLEGDLVAVQEGDWYVVKEPARSVTADNVDDFSTALAEGNVAEINLIADVNPGSQYTFPTIKSDCVVNLNGNKINAGGAARVDNNYWYALYVNGCEVVFNDADITGGGIQASNGARIIYNGSHKAVWASTSRYSFVATGGSEVIINGGSFSINNKNSCYYAYVGSTSILRINSGTFAARQTAEKIPFAIESGGQVIITGGTFGFDPSAWVAEGYEAVQVGTSTWTVSAKSSD